MFNLYGYSTNPINTVDPDGQSIVGGIIGALVGGYVSGAMSSGSFNPADWKTENWLSAGMGAINGAMMGSSIEDNINLRSLSRNGSENFSAYRMHSAMNALPNYGSLADVSIVTFESADDESAWNAAYNKAQQSAPTVAKEMKILMDADEIYYYKSVGNLSSELSAIYDKAFSRSSTGIYLGNEGFKTGGYMLTEGTNPRLIVHEAHHAFLHHQGNTAYNSILRPINMNISEEVTAFDYSALLSGSQGKNWLGLNYKQKVNRLQTIGGY